MGIHCVFDGRHPVAKTTLGENSEAVQYVRAFLTRVLITQQFNLVNAVTKMSDNPRRRCELARSREQYVYEFVIPFFSLGKQLNQADTQLQYILEINPPKCFTIFRRKIWENNYRYFFAKMRGTHPSLNNNIYLISTTCGQCRWDANFYAMHYWHRFDVKE